MEMASRGRCQEVDLTVKDVAGTEYNSNASDVIVSSFGKVAKRKALDPGTSLCSIKSTFDGLQACC
jgi:pantothenate kinase